MWHEARKQERRIRGLIVDYRRRAERRQDFYEKIQADPTQFIQIHGRRCKIHLDPGVAAAGDGAAIMQVILTYRIVFTKQEVISLFNFFKYKKNFPNFAIYFLSYRVPWQGQQDNLIDRFDVRAHLDYISPVARTSDNQAELTQEERQCNYERYRILAQNDFLNITEDKFLHQLFLEEQFGANATPESQAAQGKKKTQKSGAAIGYSYDDAGDNISESQLFSHLHHPVGGTSSHVGGSLKKTDNDSETESDSDIDMDVSIDITKLDTSQAHELNACGRNYGMLSNDFYSYLTKDLDEADALRIAREEQREKMLLSGRKSRRERKAQKERRIANRPFSPPSYAAKEDKTEKTEESDSRSPSPVDTTEKITYITSFGGEDELQPHSKISINLPKKSLALSSSGGGIEASTSLGHSRATYADKVKENLEKLKVLTESSKNPRRRDGSRSRSYTRSCRSSQRSSSSSYTRRKLRRDTRRSRSRNKLRSRTRSKSRSRTMPKRGRNMHARSRTRSRSRQRRYNIRSSSSDSTTTLRSRSSSRSTRCQKERFLQMPKSRTKTTSRSTERSKVVSWQKSPVKNKPDAVALQPEAVTHKPMVTCAKNTSASTELTTTTVPSEPAIEIIVPPPPPLKRYYGRKRDQYSSSSMSDSDSNKERCGNIEKSQDCPESLDIDTTSEKSNPLLSNLVQTADKSAGKYSTISSNVSSHSNAFEIKGSFGGGRLNLRERLKRKMQNLLNKQYKADKKAEIEKTEREKQQQQEREEEMRELALKLRRRQRELRHRHGSPNSAGSESGTSDALGKDERSKSRSIEQGKRYSHERKLVTKRTQSRERRRSRSRSPLHRRPSRYTRSRSHSHSRRSDSRRRRLSSSHARRQPESKCERSANYGSGRSHHEDRSTLSTRSRVDRDKRGEEESGRRRWERSRSGRKGCEPEQSVRHGGERSRHRRSSQRTLHSSSTTTDKSNPVGAGSSRSRVTISAPPKLKKLVDY
uniref:DRY_EERY domain-containing protein n=1 Tax=Glossina austeni TaxID=7395 RepID=A0A1A9UQ53_GLOAU